jgi:hypothetical protein
VYAVKNFELLWSGEQQHLRHFLLFRRDALGCVPPRMVEVMRMTRIDALTWVSRYASKTKGMLPWSCGSPHQNDIRLRAATKGALIFKVEKRYEELAIFEPAPTKHLGSWSSTITIDQMRSHRGHRQP